MTDDTTNELSREDILDLADAEGAKLGFLLATSPLNEKTQKAILEILEKASLEQIDAITEFFEEEYLQAQNKELNDWLKVELETIKGESDAKQKVLDDATIGKIDELEKKL